MRTAGVAVSDDLDDAIARDPEVRQARTVADAARTRLVLCMSGPEEVIDPAEAQRMLDAFREARMLAEDAEDRVLVHCGLLASAEADRRAARRRAVNSPAGGPARLAGGHPRPGRPAGAARAARYENVARVIAGLLALAAIGAAVAFARWCGVRLPRARW